MASLIPSMPVSFRLRTSVCEPVPGGVAQVHPEQLGREQRGLVAAGPGPDLEDDVAVVVRVARQEEHLELLEQSRLVGLEAVDLVARHRPHARRRRRCASRSSRAPASSGASPAGVRIGLDRRLEAGQLRPSRRISFGIGADLRACELGLEVVVLGRDLGQLGVEVAHVSAGGSPGLGRRPTGSGRFGRRRRSPAAPADARSNTVEPAGIAFPSATSASSIDVMATSIMSSVGRFVVIIWTRMPGVHDHARRPGCGGTARRA